VEVIRDVEKKAIDLTLPDIARHCQKVTTSLLALRSARLFLCECLAMLPKGASDDLLTVTEVAGRLKVNRDKVLGWIHYSRLRAANTAKGALGRPRWRIKKSDLEDFLAGRTG
jgi:excisionase family DNA binding protein